MTSNHVENILKIFLFRRDCDWKVVGKNFNLSETDIDHVKNCATNAERITKFSEHWMKSEEDPQWWKIAKSLIKCCAEETELPCLMT